jgi:glycosyltransferase involved in cell wall biosynthesis
MDNARASLNRIVRVDASVVFLTHYIPLYQVRVFEELAKRVKKFQVLLSTPIEPNRNFEIDWGKLDVTVQKNLSFRRRWKHRAGFTDDLFVHVPFDTVGQLKRIRPDVVMSHELGARSIAAAAYRYRHPLSRLLLCTYMSEHTEQGRGWLRNTVRRRLLHRADGVTYNGPSCKRYLSRLGVPNDRLFHLPYAADDRVYSSLGKHQGHVTGSQSEIGNRFICVGQLTERKGVLPLVRQLAEYSRVRPNLPLQLTLVGQGPLRDALLQVMRPEHFHLEIIEQCSPSELFSLYQQHGCAIHPTLADEWLMVVNESLHAGLPVIGSLYAQAVETMIHNGENGWVFDPLCPGELEQRLDEYFGLSNQQWLTMRMKARASIENRTPVWAAECAVEAISRVTSH